MRYQPVTLKDRSHVGKKWNRYYLRSFQIMLQATRGVVSGNPSFFLRAYGESAGDFERLLRLPHAFIFHREYFEDGEGRAQREEYEFLRGSLSKSQENELVHLLASPPNGNGVGPRHFRELANDQTIDHQIRQLMIFHGLDTAEDAKTNGRQLMSKMIANGDYLQDDEVVEDAGLFDHDEALAVKGTQLV